MNAQQGVMPPEPDPPPDDWSNIFENNISQDQIMHVIDGIQSSERHQKIIPKETHKNEDRKTAYYREVDIGPYMVIVESIENSGLNVGKRSHLKIAKDLFDLNLKDIKKIKTKGRNKLGIEFSSYLAANNFVNNDIIKNKGYKIYIPYNQVTCKGIVRRVDNEITVDEIRKMIKCSFNVLDIKRMNRKVIVDGTSRYEPTGTILVTFEGVILPRHIELCYLSMPVSPYVPPVTQCFACLLYGHVSVQCRGRRKCFNCSEHHTDDDAYKECSIIKCLYCKNSCHKTTNKTCPEYKRQQQIKRIMAFDNMSYFDASQLCKKTYSNDGEFQAHPQDFPDMINNNVNEDNRVMVSQRRTVSNEQNNLIKSKRTFAEATSSGASHKKRIVENKVGYDKSKYKDQLLYPNGRQGENPQKTLIFRNDRPNQNMENLQNLPSSALQNLNSETFATEYYNYFTQVPNIMKEKIRDMINTYYAISQTLDLDSPTMGANSSAK